MYVGATEPRSPAPLVDLALARLEVREEKSATLVTVDVVDVHAAEDDRYSISSSMFRCSCGQTWQMQLQRATSRDNSRGFLISVLGHHRTKDLGPGKVNKLEQT